jgi:hypothetical protein
MVIPAILCTHALVCVCMSKVYPHSHGCKAIVCVCVCNVCAHCNCCEAMCICAYVYA